MKKFNIKNYFSKSLYKEALSQSKITGFFLVISSMVLCSLHPFVFFLSYMQNPGWQTGLNFIDVLEGNIALLILMYIVPIFLAFNGFEFLSKRKACDFYHSIPVKREAIFTSFALAGVTWLVSSLAIGGICSTILFMTVPNLYIPIGGCFELIISLISGTLLIYFAALLAISASGNKLTQMLLTCAIIFLPHATALVLFGIVDDITGITSLSNIICTIPLVPVNALFGYVSFDFGGYFSPSIISATFAVAILLAVISGIVFTFRKSELAESNAPNKFMQHVYRTVMMVPFVLFFTAMITTSTDVITVLVPVFAVSAVIYVGYELATTKNYKTAIKSLPYYGVVIGITIILIIAVNITAFISNQITPSSDQINYVQFTRASYAGVTSKSDEYYAERAKHKITDEEIIEIIATRLEDTIEANGMTYVMKQENGNQEFYRMYVNINTGIFSYDREVLVIAEEREIIETYYAGLTDLNELVIYIPDKEDVLSVYVYGTGIDNSASIPNEVKNTILDTMYEEFYSLSKEEQYMILTNDASPSIMPVFAAVDTSYVSNQFEFRVNLTTIGRYSSELTTVYITPMLPKTYEYILNYSYQNQTGIDNSGIDGFISTLGEDSEVYIDVSISGQNGDEIVFSTYCTNDSNLTVSDCAEMLEVVKTISTDGATSIPDNLYAVEIQIENMYYKYDYSESYGDIEVETYLYYEFIAPLTEENVEFFKDMQRKQLS